MEDYSCAHRSQDHQMGYITAIARVAKDLWQRKKTLSLGFTLGLDSFTAINPWHPVL